MLEAGCDDIAGPDWDPYTGWGRINAYNSLLLVIEAECPQDMNDDDFVNIDYLFAGLAACGEDALPVGDAYVRWDTDLAKATAAAAEKGRPLMIVFR